jgi:ABC-type amino acid transport substrate-binding protein
VTHQPGSGPVRPDPFTGAAWRKARASGPQDNCVEVAFLLDGRVGVRDSKDRGKAALAVTAHAWAGFLADAKAGRFDLRP